jgi:hypothetical protein
VDHAPLSLGGGTASVDDTQVASHTRSTDLASGQSYEVTDLSFTTCVAPRGKYLVAGVDDSDGKPTLSSVGVPEDSDAYTQVAAAVLIDMPSRAEVRRNSCDGAALGAPLTENGVIDESDRRNNVAISPNEF